MTGVKQLQIYALIFQQEIFENKKYFFICIADVESGMFEGDIVLSPNDKEIVDTRTEGDVNSQAQEGILKRDIIKNKKHLWPGAVVPLEFSANGKSMANCYHGSIYVGIKPLLVVNLQILER